MEIPRVMLGSRFGFWLMPWIVEMATSARWIPYCSLCVQQPFQFLKIIDRNGFYCEMNCIIVFDPIVLRKWRWPLIRCTSITLILPKCTWIVKSSTTRFHPPFASLLLAEYRCSGFTSLMADLFLVLWFMIYECCRLKVMHSPWSVSDLWFIRLDGTLVDNKQRKSLLRSRLKSYQQFSFHNLKLKKFNV